MFVECLQRDLAICSVIQIQPFLDREPGRWHVLSIRDPIHEEQPLAQAKSCRHLVFEDVLPTTADDGPGPKAAHLESALHFAAQTATEPLVLQCWAGRSRSTAIALALIVQCLAEKRLEVGELVPTSIDILLALRPNAVPNAFVLRLGLEQFLPAPQSQTLSNALMREPRIRRNFV